MDKYMADESGRSMVELIGVLSVMGMITAGAFALIHSGQASRRISRADDDVSNIAMNIRALMAESDDFSNLPGASDLDKGTKLLDAMSLTTTTPFGSSTTYSVTQNSKDSNGFIVLLNGLSDQDCMTLAQRAWAGSVANASCDGGVLAVFFAA